MPAGYVIAQINVTDPVAYETYVRQVGPTVDRFGGEFLVRGGRAETFEAAPVGTRNVVIRFPTYQAARAWYHSDDYAPVRALRMQASNSIQTIVEGV